MYSHLFSFVTLYILALTIKQINADQPHPPPTPRAGPKTYTVVVGREKFQYQPNVTYAKQGDIVRFEFWPSNHSVVRADYGKPCVPYENKGKLTFYSGEVPVENISSNLPNWELTISDTDPIWFYSTAPDACTPNGMVGVINPAPNQSIAHQQELARNAPYQLVPGEAVPDVANNTSGATNQSGNNRKHGLSGGAIAGIVVGALAGLIFLGVLPFLLRKIRVYRAKGANIHKRGLDDDDSNRLTEPSNQWMNSTGTWSQGQRGLDSDDLYEKARLRDDVGGPSGEGTSRAAAGIGQATGDAPPYTGEGLLRSDTFNGDFLSLYTKRSPISEHGPGAAAFASMISPSSDYGDGAGTFAATRSPGPYATPSSWGLGTAPTPLDPMEEEARDVMEMDAAEDWLFGPERT